MKLKITQNPQNKHTDLVTCIAWTNNNELISCSDDRTVLTWSGDGAFVGNNFDFLPHSDGVTITDMKLSPSSGKQKSADICIVGCSDGKFYICTRAGKIEKSVEAHTGALLSLKWNLEGSALMTAGEDGVIKIWSKTGMLRSTLVKSSCPVFSVAWASDNEQVLYTMGKNLVIKSLQPGKKPSQWKAHDGLILKVDWNPVNNLIISCGEDKKYKVWDMYGRKIFSSTPFDHAITSVAWSPSGDLFAFGSFNLFGICDKLGYCNTAENPNSGSLFDISWTPDGTQVAAAGGSGSVLFGNIINRRYDWKKYQVIVEDDFKVAVQDVTQDLKEILEFKDRVIKVSLAFNYLVLTTMSQCFIYSDRNWNTPIIVDLTNIGRVTCIQQCSEYFALVDNISGIQIFSYDGNLVSQPKFPGMRGEFITPMTISISGDTVAVKDHNNEKSYYPINVDVYLFEIKNGRQIGDLTITHSVDVSEVLLNKQNTGSGRQLVLIDKNRDLFITKTVKIMLHKLGNMVDACQWNEENDFLAAITDSKLVVWYYPTAVFVDDDIAPITRYEKDASSYGANAQIVYFSGAECTIRRADGAMIAVANFSPYPGMLEEFTKQKKWEKAIRLCRNVKNRALWASLAAMSLANHELNTAEVAYAAIDEIHKVQYVCYVREIPTLEGRLAELALMRKQPKEAEKILLSANLTYRCIKMWIDLYQFDRALDIALKNNTHVDTVLYFRAKYLSSFGQKEENPKFVQLMSTGIDWNNIKSKIDMELQKERGDGAQLVAHIQTLLLQCDCDSLGRESDTRLSNLTVVDEDNILEVCLKKSGVSSDEDADFIRETFLGILHRSVFLEQTLQVFITRKNRKYDLKDYYLMAIITYLGLWQLEKLGFRTFAHIVEYHQQSYMLDLISFLFNANLIQSELRQLWSTILEEEYVLEWVIEPLLRHLSSAEALKRGLENLLKFGSKSGRNVKQKTIVDPFLLTVPKVRRVPSPTVIIPTSIKPLPIPKSLYTKPKEQVELEKKSISNKTKAVAKLSVYNKNSFKAAIPPSNSKKEAIKAKLEEELKKSSNAKIYRPVPDYVLKSKSNVKLNVTSILREDALLRKKDNEQKKIIEQIEMGLPDENEIESLKLAMKAKEEDERALAMERKRLEVQLAHEEAILARQELLQENKERAEKLLNEKRDLKQLSDTFKAEIAIENRQKKVLVDAIQANVVKAREKVLDEKIQKASAVQAEKREIQEQIRKQQEEDFKNRAVIIQQIRLLESQQIKSQPKDIDLSETSGLGLLGEMSIADVSAYI